MADTVEPSARDLPMTVADHVMANAMIAIVTMRIFDAPRITMLRDIAREAVVQSDNPNPIINDLRVAAWTLIEADMHSVEWSRARWIAETSLTHWAEWRMAQALERMRGETS